jgi:DNA (cytosine-5)-methyltransferase 1
MNVDITKQSVVTAVEWFYGYGGNALGLKRAIPGLRSVAVSERDAFVVANMVSKMEKGLLDSVPIWTDVTDFPTEPFGYQQLDLFIASYPCQGFSHAGKRLGADDPRHLWPYCRKFIAGTRPAFVWLENVEGHVSLGLSTVLADLEEDGYTAAWGIFSASEVGAPHQRKRVFILAYDRLQRQAVNELKTTGIVKCGSEDELALRVSEGLQGHGGNVNGEGWGPEGPVGPVTEESVRGTAWPSRPGQAQYGWEPPRVSGNMDDPKRGSCGQHNGPEFGQGHLPKGADEARNETDSQTQPPLGGNINGTSPGLDLAGLSGLCDSELAEIRGWMDKGTNRTDELRLNGNGVVPQTAEKAWRILYAELCSGKTINVAI